MRKDPELVDLGAEVCSIRRTATGEMILELMLDKERRVVAYKSLKEVVFDEGVEVRALTTEATLKLKTLDEVNEVKELVTALRQQCEV